jgi:hypothetical protein
MSYHKAFKDCGAESIKQMPLQFTSLDEAEIYFELFMRRMMHFIAASAASSTDSTSTIDADSGPHMKGGILNTNPIPIELRSLEPQNSQLARSITQLGQVQRSHTETADGENGYSLNASSDWKPRDQGYAILNSMYCLLFLTIRPCLPTLIDDAALTTRRYRLTSTTEEYRMHMNECMAWAHSYTTLRNTLKCKEISLERIRAEFLWLRYLTSYVTISCFQSVSQMVYDDYVQYFKEIIRIAKILQAHPTGNSIFVFDTRYIPQLYFAAIRCRDPYVRREAIGVMLAKPYREGVWDSFQAGKMAAAVMEIEEEGMINGSFIPEESRVRGTTIDFNLPNRTGTLKCFLSSSQGPMVKERHISW